MAEKKTMKTTYKCFDCDVDEPCVFTCPSEQVNWQPKRCPLVNINADPESNLSKIQSKANWQRQDVEA